MQATDTEYDVIRLRKIVSDIKRMRTRCVEGCEKGEDGSSAVSFLPFMFGMLIILMFFIDIGTYVYIYSATDTTAYKLCKQVTQDMTLTEEKLTETAKASSAAFSYKGGTLSVERQIELPVGDEPLSESYTHHLPNGSSGFANRYNSTACYRLCQVSVTYKYTPATPAGRLMADEDGNVSLTASYVGTIDETASKAEDGLSRW